MAKVVAFKRPLLMDQKAVIKCTSEEEYKQVNLWCDSKGLTLLPSFNLDKGCYVHVANANVFPLGATMKRRILDFNEALEQ